eukprot:scpid94318/ scgid6025/ 
MLVLFISPDPEEFLILMWEKILGADPFLKLKTPQQDGNSTFMHQLFVPSEGNKKIATVQELLEQSFSESQLMLREVWVTLPEYVVTRNELCPNGRTTQVNCIRTLASI